MPNKLTKSEFIERATKIHGDKYDYSKVEYKNTKTRICIICPEHGHFYTTPNAHISNKRGCRFCGYKKMAATRKLSNEDFLKKARQIHGNKFDYSKVNYVNNQTKICIIDENGNEFWQTPNNHLSGFDCTVNKLNTQFFIEKSRKIHDDKYDYSKVEYKNAKTKVCIICPEHGEFWQLPHGHLSGKGCSKCSLLNIKNKLTNDLDVFIERAKEKHGNKYDYSKVEYINNRVKICIICPEHGEFWQTPSNHLKGAGCSKCSGNMMKTTEIFINNASKIHGNKYDYSKVNYKNVKTKVCIICSEHGEFWQLPENHIIKGYGCPECAKLYRKKETELYNTLNKTFCDTNVIHSYYNSEILGKQEIDIYFPEYKIGVEFQGEQHFKPIDFGGYGNDVANNLFKENQLRDKKKKHICETNNITLLYFSNIKIDAFLGEKVYHMYDDLIERIDQIIKKESEK